MGSRIWNELRRGGLAVFSILLWLSILSGGCGSGETSDSELILATTTSLQDSGLLDVLVPLYQEQSGIRVKIIAVGTGQALALAGRGEADAVLTHAPEAEIRLVEDGSAVDRRLLMYNDFVLVGPPADPARAASARGVVEALSRIAGSRALFISRGDDSGTHKREKALWQAAGIQPRGVWYQEAAVGMGQTLTIASEKEAYTLTDRATYLALRHRLRLRIWVEGDPRLLNLYHVMRVNPQRFRRVHGEAARAWVSFLTRSSTMARVDTFGVARFGRPLFVPAVGLTEDQVRRRFAGSR